MGQSIGVWIRFSFRAYSMVKAGQLSFWLVKVLVRA
jgi:hypothetical protein